MRTQMRRETLWGWFARWIAVSPVWVVLVGLPAMGLRAAEEFPYPGTTFRAGDCGMDVWIPDGVEVLKGVMVAEKGADHDWTNMCAMWEFAHINHNVWPCNSSLDKAGWKEVFDEAAEKSGHPEFKHAPFIIHGFSRHGDEPFKIMNHWPERTITISSGQPVRSSEEKYHHPENIPILHSHECGAGDEPPEDWGGINAMPGDLQPHRKLNKQVCYVPMWGWGHGYYSIRDFEWVWFDRIIKLRVPEDDDARDGPVQLKDIDVSRGWLGDPRSWRDVWPLISPDSSYSGDKSLTAWLPNEELAWLWRAYVSRHPTENQKEQGEEHVGGMATTYKFPGQANMIISSPTRPYHLKRVGGKFYHLTLQGNALTLSVRNHGIARYDNIEKIAVYDGNEKLTDIKPNSYGVYSAPVTLPRLGVRPLSAQLTLADGKMVTTRPALTHVLPAGHYDKVMATRARRTTALAWTVAPGRDVSAVPVFDIRGRSCTRHGPSGMGVYLVNHSPEADHRPGRMVLTR